MWNRDLAARWVPTIDLDSSLTARASQPVFQEVTGMIEVCLVEVGPAAARPAVLVVWLW